MIQPSSEKAWVSLCYDGGLLDHLETALIQLNQFELRGSFGVPTEELLENASDWRKASEAGHELMQGVLLNPAPGPETTLADVREDLLDAEELLRDLRGGSSPSTVALPWASQTGHDYAALSTELAGRYCAIRTGIEGFNPFDPSRALRLKIFPCDEANGRELMRIARRAIAERKWCIFAFQGIGVGEPSVDVRAHLELCAFLANSLEIVEVEPVETFVQMLENKRNLESPLPPGGLFL